PHRAGYRPRRLAFDRKILARSWLPVHADAALCQEPPRFRAAGREPHRLQERRHVNAPRTVLVLAEDALGHPHVLHVSGDLMPLMDEIEPSLRGLARPGSVVEVHDGSSHPSLLIVRVQRAIAKHGDDTAVVLRAEIRSEELVPR